MYRGTRVHAQACMPRQPARRPAAPQGSACGARLRGPAPEAQAGQQRVAGQARGLAGQVQRERLGQHAQRLPQVRHEDQVGVAPGRELHAPDALDVAHELRRARAQLRGGGRRASVRASQQAAEDGSAGAQGGHSATALTPVSWC